MNIPEQDISILNKVKVLGGHDISIIPHTIDDILFWKASPSIAQLWNTYEEAVEEAIIKLPEFVNDCRRGF